ncbi:MAG: DnaJ domain-containing protein [Syntrophobacteraceae bacterium]|nr:J domain-containing protein [Desulfobacteraceae bacterium]
MAFIEEKICERDYRTLGLECGAEPEKVKQAYRELAKRWHPDRFQQQTPLECHRAEEKFKEITAAYRRISKTWKDRESVGAETRKARETPRPTAPPRKEPVSRKPAARRPSPAGADIGLRQFLGIRFKHMPPSWHSKSAAVVAALAVLAAALIMLPFPDWFDLDDSPPSRTVQPQDSHRLVTRPPGEPSPRSDPVPEPPPSPGPAPDGTSDGTYYTLGSTQAEVLRIQGAPSRTQGQTWVYGLADIQFKDGRLWRYNNFDGSLKIRLTPTTSTEGDPPAFFTLGSTQNDVLLVQGTPTQIGANKWHYGFSEIRFKDGRVEEYNNFFGNLKIRLVPSESPNPTAKKGYFTIGSSRDEVLSLQGTPTVIQGNTWYYQSSYITFRDGRVQFAISLDGNLFFLPSEETTEKSDSHG